MTTEEISKLLLAKVVELDVGFFDLTLEKERFYRVPLKDDLYIDFSLSSFKSDLVRIHNIESGLAKIAVDFKLPIYITGNVYNKLMDLIRTLRDKREEQKLSKQLSGLLHKICEINGFIGFLEEKILKGHIEFALDAEIWEDVKLRHWFIGCNDYTVTFIENSPEQAEAFSIVEFNIIIDGKTNKLDVPHRFCQRLVSRINEVLSTLRQLPNAFFIQDKHVEAFLDQKFEN